MAADDLTSLSQMKSLQFKDKMAALNRDFLKALRVWYEQCPHFDFSDSVKSYLRHVETLDKQYGGPVHQKENEPQPSKPNGKTPEVEVSGRKIAKAKRRLGNDPDKLNDSVTVSTPAVKNPPRFSLGNVSAIERDSESPPAAINEPASGAGGRKRAIRGGGPLGGKEQIVFRGSEDTTSTAPSIPPVTVQLPKLTTGFWNKKPEEGKSDEEVFKAAAEKRNLVAEKKDEAPKSQFNLLKPTTDNSGSDKAPEDKPKFGAFQGFNFKKDSGEKKDESPNTPLFGGFNKKNDSEEKSDKPAPLFAKKNEAPAAGSEANIETSKPSFSFGGFNKKDESSEKTDKPTLSFGSVNKKEGSDLPKPSLSFPSFGAKKDDDSSPKPSLSFPGLGMKKDDASAEKPALSFPSFGSSATTTFGDGSKPALSFPAFGNVSTGAPTLSFGPPKTEGGNDEGEGEYVPPKAEVVESEEPGSTYSQKCSVFKMIDKKFTKMGVGMLHLKEVDDKKSVLVRAATTTGNVWVNAVINQTMKVAKVDEKGDRLRLTFPISSGEIGIFVVRFGSVAAAEKVLNHIDENNK